MNSLEISRILSIVRKHTLGVFPADKIVERWQKPCAFVFNTDDSTKPGVHWVAVYFSRDGCGTYFDSFGLEPLIPNHLRLLRKNCRVLRWNTKQLQSNSSKVCGQFCLMFLIHMSRGKTLKQFQNIFSSNLDKNDGIVKDFVKRLNLTKFPKGNKRYFVGGLIDKHCSQKCTSRYGW